MKLLLDTHAALWWWRDDQRLGPEADRRLTDQSDQVLLSAVVIWEVAIKRSIGKLTVPDGLAVTLVGAGAVALPITLEHAAATEELPWHHHDPFDRLLIAQAQVERAAIVSRDPALALYDVSTVW